MSKRGWFLPWLCCLFIILLGRFSFIAQIRSKARLVLSPVYNLGWDCGNWVVKRMAFIKNISSLKSDNDFLRNQLNLAYSQLVFYRSLEEENQSLRKQLLAARNDRTFIPVLAKVLSSGVLGSSTTFFLDQGAASGVRVGDCVVKESLLLGKVEQVDSNFSLVRLITDPNLRLGAFVDHGVQTGAKGIVRGDYGNSLIMEQILSDFPLVTGELVVALSESPQVPENLILGRLEKVTSRDQDPLKTARLQTLVD